MKTPKTGANPYAIYGRMQQYFPRPDFVKSLSGAPNTAAKKIADRAISLASVPERVAAKMPDIFKKGI